MSSATVPQKEIALLLPGGGARASYQVGVLKALAEIYTGSANPFPILCGTSAGAINAVVLASREAGFAEACSWLEGLWMDLRADHVYRTDLRGMANNSWRLFLSLFNAGVATGRPVALLDNKPLKELLKERVDFSGIGRNLLAKRLSSISITAMNYTERVSVSFFQGGPAHAGWQRWRRQGIPTPLQLRHVIASTAIPTIFPPQRIGRSYYGDGALRQLTPISPALHLGAEKVLIISPTGHRRNYEKPYRRVHSPAMGQVVAHLLNSAFVDSLETDIEMLEQMNQLLQSVPGQLANQDGRIVRPIETLVISPSEDIDMLAEEYVKDLPRNLKSFLRIVGGSSSDGGVNVASYLLFSRDFNRRLIELGYKDGHAFRPEVCALLGQTDTATAGQAPS